MIIFAIGFCLLNSLVYGGQFFPPDVSNKDRSIVRIIQYVQNDNETKMVLSLVPSFGIGRIKVEVEYEIDRFLVRGMVEYWGNFNGYIWNISDSKKVFEFYFENGVWLKGRYVKDNLLVVFIGVGDHRLFLMYEDVRDGWIYLDLDTVFLEDWSYVLWNKVLVSGEVVGGGFFRRDKDGVWRGVVGCNWNGGWVRAEVMKKLFKIRNLYCGEEEVVNVRMGILRLFFDGDELHLGCGIRRVDGGYNCLVYLALDNIGDILSIRKDIRRSP